MSIQVIIFVVLGLIAIWMLLNPLTKNRKEFNETPIKNPMVQSEEPNRYDEPVENDPELNPNVLPIDEDGEMPIRPTPRNCQKGTFRPAPELYSYTDCCGNIQQGEGFQPWEKRPPIDLDVNLPFEGIDLIGEDGNQDC